MLRLGSRWAVRVLCAFIAFAVVRQSGERPICDMLPLLQVDIVRTKYQRLAFNGVTTREAG
jgi:hypothetical protein